MTSELSLTIRVRHRDGEPLEVSGAHHVGPAMVTSSVQESRAVPSSIAGDILTTVVTEVAGPISTGVLAAWIYDRFIKGSDETSISIDPSELLLRDQRDIEEVIDAFIEDEGRARRR